MSKKYTLPKKTLLLMAMSTSAIAGGGASIQLEQTVGTNTAPGACGTETLIAVNLGDSVNYCYTVTNNGTEDVFVHDLLSSEFGTILNGATLLLGPSEDVSFNDIRTLSKNVTNNATWTASTPSFTTLPDAFEDISTTGTPLGLGDESTAPVVIPFPFTYFGNTSSDIVIGNNGGALFGVQTGTVTWQNGPLPTADSPIIAPFWSDLDTQSTGSEVFYETLGTPPNQRFIVQWHKKNVYLGSDGEDVTFQMALFETTNEIQFRYNDVVFGGSAAAADAGAAATVGIDSGDGTNAIMISFQQPSLSDGLTLSLDSNTPPISVSDSAETTVLVNIPEASINPSDIDTQIASMGTGSETITIGNTGMGVLNWSVEEAPMVQHITDFPQNYQSEKNLDQSVLADVNTSPKNASRIQQIPLGAGSDKIAFGVDVRNSMFGYFNLNNPDLFSNSHANARALFAGDFLNNDFTKLYVVDNDSRELLTLDIYSGAENVMGTLVTNDPSETISGMTEDPNDGTIYISTTNGTNSYLYTMDSGTYALTYVGEVTGSALLIDIAISASGDLFGFDIGDDNLYAINTSTGAGTLVGNIGVDASFAQGMDFDYSTNQLYLAAYTGGGTNQVLILDTATGASTSLGSINPNSGGGEVDALAIPNANPECVMLENISWMSFDTNSGIVGTGDTDDVMVQFDATALNDGIYEASVCVFTNDPNAPVMSIPVTLQVGPDDLIFTSGFEAPTP